jgi:hypothetical protein
MDDKHAPPVMLLNAQGDFVSLSSPRKTVLFTCGWMIAAAAEDAIRQVPADARAHLGDYFR